MNGVAKATNMGVSSSEKIVSNLRFGISKMETGCPALTASSGTLLAARAESDGRH
jgi:hypothetical protein